MGRFLEHINLINKFKYLSTLESSDDSRMVLKNVLQGISNDNPDVLDKRIGQVTYTSGSKTQPRSVLYDENVRSTEVPILDDNPVYRVTVLDLVNRYLASIKQDNPRNYNKITSLLVKLFSLDISWFINSLDLSSSYVDVINGILKRISTADSILVNTIERRILDGSYDDTVLDMSDEQLYLYLLDESLEPMKDHQTVDDIREYLSNVDNSDSNWRNTATIEDLPNYMTADEVLRAIKELLVTSGPREFLRYYINDVLNREVVALRSLDKELASKVNRFLIGIKNKYQSVTYNISLGNYQKLFNINPNTYKDNKNKVINEISKSSSSEEFNKFKELIINS